MKPLILKTYEGLYICEIPIENEPEDGATDAEWWIWAATGVSSSPVEAYQDWLEDCSQSLEVYDEGECCEGGTQWGHSWNCKNQLG